jgi:hypothetical protein
MHPWINDFEVPPELLALLDNPATPGELWKEILKARDEAHYYGLISDATRASVESCIRRHRDLVASLLSRLDDTGGDKT